MENLAIDGGPRTREKPWPGRSLLGLEEKRAADAMFDQAMATGEAFGYNGAQEVEYCRMFSEFMGGGFADAVSSGTTAVYVALKALNIEPFTEVVVSPVTDPGGIMPIPLLNCIPIVADAAPGRYNTGPEQIEAELTPRTSAIVVSHIGGEPADIAGIVEVARKRKIPVVEDCAQSHGATLNGRQVGSFGDIAAFSTMFGKHHCTGGQGGVVFTKNEDLYWSVRRVSDRGKPFGLPEGATNSVATLNFNLNDLAAAIGIEQLKKLPGIVSRRRAVVAELAKTFAKLKTISIPEMVPGGEHVYWWWRLKVNTENIARSKMDFCAALLAEGLLLAPRYNAMPHTFDWFKNKNVFGSSRYPWACPLYKGDPSREFPCPNAIEAIDTHFNLVIHESWGEQEIRDIAAAFAKVDAALRNKKAKS